MTLVERDLELLQYYLDGGLPPEPAAALVSRLNAEPILAEGLIREAEADVSNPKFRLVDGQARMAGRVGLEEQLPATLAVAQMLDDLKRDQIQTERQSERPQNVPADFVPRHDHP